MALEQHAIPTEVTNYEFRLVGDWTLKQFGWIAGGIILGILFFSAQIIPPWFRWPLTIFFPLLGLAIGLVPYEGRTLDRWIIAFIKAIYAPTEFIWRKEKILPAYLTVQPKVPRNNNQQQQATKIEQARIQEYIHNLPIEAAADEYDKFESQDLSNINQMLAQTYPSAFNNPQPQLDPSQNPFLLNQPGSMLSYQEEEGQSTIQTPQQSNQPTDFELEQLSQQIAGELQPSTKSPDETTPTETTESTGQTESPYRSLHQPDFSDPLHSAMSSNELQDQFQNNTDPIESTPLAQASSQQLDPHLLPLNPTKPNIVVGVVVDSQNKPIPDAIIEIKNPQGHPVRALKTNQLGQFSIASPLSPGDYRIHIDKEGYQFSTYSFKANNQILQPIPFQAL